eukprot:5851025-Amphidinium_carterae.1
MDSEGTHRHHGQYDDGGPSICLSEQVGLHDFNYQVLAGFCVKLKLSSSLVILVSLPALQASVQRYCSSVQMNKGSSSDICEEPACPPQHQPHTPPQR